MEVLSTMSGVNDIQYVQLTQEDLDEVLHLLAKEFYPRESLVRHYIVVIIFFSIYIYIAQTCNRRPVIRSEEK